MANNQQTKILSPEKITTLRIPLSQNWLKAAGILKKRRINPLNYQRQIRKEWEKRLKKLSKISSHGS